jgi:hypothetical protein
MKYYREMEINSATTQSSSSTNATSSKNKGISKGSISHLHLLESKEEDKKKIHGHPNPQEVVRRTDNGAHPSLFQRFSKTFSLRFGSSSSVNKVNGVKNGHGKQVQGPLGIGSSPDLHNRFIDVQR